MMRRLASAGFALLAAAVSAAEAPPQGEVSRHELTGSAIYPGANHGYWLYIPAQYKADRPACLYVGQDGPFNVPAAFDALIARGEIPVTIGVFVAPGVVPAASSAALPRYNRSYEYDSLGDAYARFLLEELLPDAERQHAADGRPVKLSRRAADRAIGGQSSGAIAAFTAAWERPDSFSRVFSAVGTYVGLRGGDRYPGLIRKYEPKPIRVFLQDGSADLNIYGGDWWMANQTMERALEFAGYDVAHRWGAGGHNGVDAAALLPEAMRWLWRGWPEPVKAGASRNQMLGEILRPDSGWELAAQGYRTTDGPAANAQGELFYDDGPGGRIYQLGAQGPQIWDTAGPRHAGQAFGPDGRLYGILGVDTIAVFTPNGPQPVARGLDRANDLVVAHNGNLYVTSDPPAGLPAGPGRVWLIRPDGAKVEVDTGLKFPNGIALSPDQSLLYVDDSRSHWVYSYAILPDGTLHAKQRYFDLVGAETDDDTGADGMRVDRDGRLYVTTRLGIQVCDQAGRVNAILPTPNGRVSNLAFGGPKFDVLYATCGDRVYRRRLAVEGANAWAEPNRPAPPHL